MPTDDPTNVSDEDLMKHCQEGDELAFEVLFTRYETQTITFIRKLIGDESRTEALAQEAFLRIFKDSKSYKYPSSFSTWFYSLVRKLCKVELHSRGTANKINLEPPALENKAYLRSRMPPPRPGDFGPRKRI
jgi:RNA polymerase sigma-70 factor (ECF subfamily)